MLSFSSLGPGPGGSSGRAPDMADRPEGQRAVGRREGWLGRRSRIVVLSLPFASIHQIITAHILALSARSVNVWCSASVYIYQQSLSLILVDEAGANESARFIRQYPHVRRAVHRTLVSLRPQVQGDLDHVYLGTVLGRVLEHDQSAPLCSVYLEGHEDIESPPGARA